MQAIELVIPGQPITKKNSQQIIQIKGRASIVPSRAYKAYLRNARAALADCHLSISTPVNIKCLYYMQTKRVVDLTNLLSATMDVLVFYKVVSDDNCLIVPSNDGSRVRYDKEHPRVEITITPSEEELPW